jgi:hypothetical protein
MKNSVQIFMKDQAVIHYEATVKKTTNIFVNVHELQEGHSSLFLVIDHPKTNSVLELSKVAPFALLYFDDDLQFAGAAYSLDGSERSFGTGTAFKKILLLSYPIPFDLAAVSHLVIK